MKYHKITSWKLKKKQWNMDVGKELVIIGEIGIFPNAQKIDSVQWKNSGHLSLNF